VEVVIRVDKKYDQVMGTEEKKDILGYLITEFVSLTGMSDEQRADYKTIREIAPDTKLKPDERMKQT
jgi:predicted RNA-binding protein